MWHKLTCACVVLSMGVSWAASGRADTVLVDFGITSLATHSADSQGRMWNNVSGDANTAAVSQTYVDNAVTSSGAATTTSIGLTAVGSPVFTPSTPTGSIANTGNTMVDEAPYYWPSTVWQDAINVYSADANYVTVNIGGLVAGETYTLSAFGLRGSSAGGPGPRETIYTIGESSITVNTWDNASTFAVFENVSPDASGAISMVVKEFAGGNSNGYLNAMVIDGKFNAVPEPSTLVMGVGALLGLALVALRKRFSK